MEVTKSKTFNNLAKSFAGECQARVTYEFIEYGARYNGYKALAEVVDKIVYNEFNHARMFYTFMQQAKDTEITNEDITAGYPFKEKWDLTDNFRIAAEDERREAEIVYPEFARIAKEEGFKEIAELYENIIQVETCHKMQFEQIYEQLKNGTLYKRDKPVKWKCGDCGYESTANEAWDECPLCKAKRGSVLLDLES